MKGQKPVVPFESGDIVRVKKTGEICCVRSFTIISNTCGVYCPASGITRWFGTDELELVCDAVIVTRAQYDKLVTNQRDPLDQPEPPTWLRVGWWYSMDDDGTWWATQQKPTVDLHCGEWTAGGNTLPIEDNDWISWHGRSVPVARWQDACWQVTK